MIEKLFESTTYSRGQGIVGGELPAGAIGAQTFSDVGMDAPAPEVTVDMQWGFCPTYGTRAEVEAFRDWMVSQLDAAAEAAWPSRSRDEVGPS